MALLIILFWAAATPAAGDSAPVCVGIERFLDGLDSTPAPVVRKAKAGTRAASAVAGTKRYIYSPYAPQWRFVSFAIEVLAEAEAIHYRNKNPGPVLRIKPVGTSHAIALIVTAISHDPGDVSRNCPSSPDHACIVSSWTFEGPDANLHVDMNVATRIRGTRGRRAYVDRVTLSAAYATCGKPPNQEQQGYFSNPTGEDLAPFFFKGWQ